MLSWVGLVEQVLPSRDSCWLASANGAVMSSSRMVIQTIYCPAQGPAAAAAVAATLEQLEAAPGSKADNAACIKKEQPGCPLQQQQQQ